MSTTNAANAVTNYWTALGIKSEVASESLDAITYLVHATPAKVHTLYGGSGGGAFLYSVPDKKGGNVRHYCFDNGGGATVIVDNPKTETCVVTLHAKMTAPAKIEKKPNGVVPVGALIDAAQADVSKQMSLIPRTTPIIKTREQKEAEAKKAARAAKQEKHVEGVEKKKVLKQGGGMKVQVRAILLANAKKGITVDQIAKDKGWNPVSIKTCIGDLKNPTYAIGKPLVYEKLDDGRIKAKEAK